MKTIIAALLILVSVNACAQDIDYTWRDQDTARAVVLVLEHAIDANQTKHIKLHQNKCEGVSTPYYETPYTDSNGTVGVQVHGSTYKIVCSGALQEQNSIIGQNASNAKINGYFVALSLLEIVVSTQLPQGYRDVFQYVRIIDTGITINNNHSLGLGFSVGF
jgi:hypothetical protein